jgi:hypothetical protein
LSGKFSSPPMTLFNPPIFWFYLCIKTSERVFRSFSSLNSSKTSENTFRISSSRQKNFVKRVPKFKSRGKNENPGGGKSHGGWEEKISHLAGLIHVTFKCWPIRSNNAPNIFCFSICTPKNLTCPKHEKIVCISKLSLQSRRWTL